MLMIRTAFPLKPLLWSIREAVGGVYAEMKARLWCLCAWFQACHLSRSTLIKLGQYLMGHDAPLLTMLWYTPTYYHANRADACQSVQQRGCKTERERDGGCTDERVRQIAAEETDARRSRMMVQYSAGKKRGIEVKGNKRRRRDGVISSAHFRECR